MSTAFPGMDAIVVEGNSVNFVLHLSGDERTFLKIFEKIQLVLPANIPHPCTVVLEKTTHVYQHDLDTLGDMSLKVTSVDPPFAGELGIANIVWGKNELNYMCQKNKRFDVHLAWSNDLCQYFVVKSNSALVRQVAETWHFPRIDGLLLYGERIVLRIE
jgi:hypothetical protein